ncbi:DNA-directed RNA polymerase subunit RpoH/Rpb5 C-terminal domain-containing protein [Caldiplasma sukawensis]
MGKFDILHHNVVPEHYLVEVKEENKILLKLNVTKDLLPKISINDPAIKALMEIYGEIQPGRIIKIVRRNEKIGPVEYYRVVSNEVLR